jgi:hypothetical protein
MIVVDGWHVAFKTLGAYWASGTRLSILSSLASLSRWSSWASAVAVAAALTSLAFLDAMAGAHDHRDALGAVLGIDA